MRSVPLTRFWYRRLCEVALVLATSLLVLFVWSLVSQAPSDSVLAVHWLTALASLVTLSVASLAYRQSPQAQVADGPATKLWPGRPLAMALAVYLSLWLMVSMLVLSSGAVYSPFVALWAVVVVFGGALGPWGVVVPLVGLNIYLLAAYPAGDLTPEAIITVLLAGEIPALLGFLVWYRAPAAATPGDATGASLSRRSRATTDQATTVINALADGVVALDAADHIQLINPAAQRLLGWNEADAVGLSYQSVVRLLTANAQPLETGRDPVATVRARGGSVTVSDLWLRPADHKAFAAAITVSATGAGSIIITFRDITRQQAEEREKSEFISTASHEMRTPVASIEGYLGLALNPATATLDPRARDFVGKAHAAAGRLGQLFQDLLDISRADDGKLPTTRQVVELGGLVGSLTDGLAGCAHRKGLTLTYQPLATRTSQSPHDRRLSPDYYAKCDPSHIQRILTNLIDNAVKYTPAGSIIVDVTGDTREVVISVTDTGIGIPEADLGHIFQKFYRIDNSQTRQVGGSGLGLYLCRRLAEVMGGRIWAERHDHGSRFCLALPRLSASQVAHPVAPAPPPVRRHPRAAPEAIPDRPAPGVAPALRPGGIAPPPPRTTPSIPSRST